MKKAVPLSLRKSPDKNNKKIPSICSFVFWLAMWELAALFINKELFLPTPQAVITCFFKLAKTSVFWKSIAFSMKNIISGFFLALLSGLFFAFASYFFPIISSFISLPLKIIRTIPVASFIILALLWVSSLHLSMFIAFLTVLPIIYTNIYSGLESIDSEMIIMSDLYNIPFFKKCRLLYLPSVKNSLFSAIETGAGFAWKSGIAAEVIGITKNSIGNNLNQAKVYLETTQLFAWTLTVIIISLLFEKAATLTIGGYFHDKEK